MSRGWGPRGRDGWTDWAREGTEKLECGGDDGPGVAPASIVRVGGDLMGWDGQNMGKDGENWGGELHYRTLDERGSPKLGGDRPKHAPSASPIGGINLSTPAQVARKFELTLSTGLQPRSKRASIRSLTRIRPRPGVAS